MTDNLKNQTQPNEKRAIKQDTSPYMLAVFVAIVVYSQTGSVRLSGFVLIAGLIVSFAYHGGAFKGMPIEVVDFLGHLNFGRTQKEAKKKKLEGGIYDVFLGHDDETGAAVIENLLNIDCAGFYGIRGGGKTTFLHTIIHGIVVNHDPSEIRLVIADLKEGLDFRIYRQLRHLLWPVATTADEAAVLVVALRGELERRGRYFKAIPSHRLCNSLDDYHRINDELGLGMPHLPLIVAVIDEFQNVTNQSKDALNGLIDLAKMGRAFGIITMVATQLPNVDSLPSDLKSQFSTKFVGYMANPSNYYKIAEVPQEFWKPFHEQGKIRGRFIASIAGRYFVLRVYRVLPRELELVAQENGTAASLKMPNVERAKPLRKKWKGSNDQKRAMLIEWFESLVDMPTETDFVEAFESSPRTYYSWVRPLWEETH